GGLERPPAGVSLAVYPEILEVLDVEAIVHLLLVLHPLANGEDSGAVEHRYPQRLVQVHLVDLLVEVLALVLVVCRDGLVQKRLERRVRLCARVVESLVADDAPNQTIRRGAAAPRGRVNGHVLGSEELLRRGAYVADVYVGVDANSLPLLLVNLRLL